MKERIITIDEARQRLENPTRQSSEETLIITCDNQPALALMTYQAYQALQANIESLQNVLEVMLGGEKMDTPRPTRAVLKSDRHISWEEFQKEVGWD